MSWSIAFVPVSVWLVPSFKTILVYKLNYTVILAMSRVTIYASLPRTVLVYTHYPDWMTNYIVALVMDYLNQDFSFG